MSITWHPDPVAFHLGAFPIRWYGLLYAIGFWSAYLIFERIMLLEGKTRDQARQILLCMIGGTAIGGRLGHCFFYHPAEYWAHPTRILDFRDGGNSSHGATLILILAILVYSRIARIGFRWLCDRLCVAIALAAAFVRLGNMMNSELVGIPTCDAWGVMFLRVDSIPRHPAVLYEATILLLILTLMLWLYFRTTCKNAPGRLWGIFFILVFGARFFVDFYKAAEPAISVPIPLAITQLLCFPCLIFGMGLVGWSLRIARNTPTETPSAAIANAP